MNKIINAVNAYNSILGQKLQYFMNRPYIWPHSSKMYPKKFTCSCRVEISTGNTHVFCSDLFISPQIRILLSKNFLVHHLINVIQKNTPWFFKGTEISAITLHACIFYSAGSHVCFCINRKSRVWFECQTFKQDFFVNRNEFFILKMSLLWLIL